MAITTEQLNFIDAGLPVELKGYQQWVVWKYVMRNGEWTKVPYQPLSMNAAKANDPSTWGGYVDAMNTANNPATECDGVGFMLSPDDPYVFIDLDDVAKRDQDGALIYADENRDEMFAVQRKIVDEFDSYTELSPSGRGVHIITKCEGKNEIFKHGGGRRLAVEIYASGRFMTMTGNVIEGRKNIWGRKELVSILYRQVKVRNNGFEPCFTPGNAQFVEDEEIIRRGCNAKNGDKFSALIEGRWQELGIGDGSQSVADQALLNMLTFYSGNREQIKRIFMNSGMYRPDKKSTKNGRSYLDFSIDKAFDMTPPEIDIAALTEQWDAMRLQEQQQPEQSSEMFNEPVQLIGGNVDEMPEMEGITKPAGLIGEIADYIYASAPRPVPEIALAGAIALVAGIAGRAYNISSTGLNQYIVLLAGTGTGKEAAASGMSRLVSALTGRIEDASKYIGPSKFSSAPALLKHLADVSPSFVSVFGEFGMYMSQMSGDKAAGYMVELRRAFLDLFNKSGRGQTLQSSVYSDSQKNSKNVAAPAFSFLGETTPERFYENLSEDLISEGFLPRITVIEYTGIRVPLNESHASVKIPQELLQRLSALALQAQMLNAKHTPHDVVMSDEAIALQREFNIYCDNQINDPDANTVTKELWNRAHLKALKMAGLVAVGINQYNPEVDATIMQWGINLAMRDCNTIIERFKEGNIGNGVSESAQERKMIETFRWWFETPVEGLRKQGETYRKAREAYMLPYRVIQQRLTSKAAFKNDRRGAAAALRATLENMKRAGIIQQVSPKQAEDVGVFGELYTAMSRERLLA
ncbi:replicative primase/helicase [Achromobacter phage phiAxp-1]|uniref:DNA primase n=1 Tax=Achromobacter phage phiAxp-1 TaxID=1610509 RepID=UPI000654EFA1|nr:DNA primase [Achromobacter phage phiAxp-1]AKJ71397.1 replicative primase/helicase [Achromobacter phage phiAxp-1]